MPVFGQSLASDWVAESDRSLIGEVEQISLQNCLANAPTAALSNMVPITLIAISCFSIPDWKLMSGLLAMQLAINLIKLTFSKRIKSPEDWHALRFYEMVLAMSGAVWGAMLLPLAAMEFRDITTSVIFVILIGTIAITSMAIASQRRFFTAFILGFVATSVPIALVHMDMVGIMPNLALLGFIYILDSMTKASFKQTREHIRGQIENRALADMLATALQHSDYLAKRDSLTGLLNRRAFEEAACTMRSDARNACAQCIIILDLDHFKSINDKFGHSNGDVALQYTAAVLNEILATQHGQSGSDFAIARWGGEEFIILLDHCPAERAAQLAEDIRIALRSRGNPRWPSGMSVSGSLGVAIWSDHMDLNVAVSRADGALYRAKNAGRNRVCVYGNDRERHERASIGEPHAALFFEEVA